MRNSDSGAGVSRAMPNSRSRSVDRHSRTAWLLACVVLALAGCAGGTGGGSNPPQPQPSTCSVLATATPASPPKGGCSGAPLSSGELRLLLIDQLGPPWYCDRDSYPVGRDEQEAAIASYDAMVADAEVFPAVAVKLGLDPPAKPTDAQKLALYRLWKAASAVVLDPIGNDRYRFDYLAQPVGGASQGTRSAGIVDAHGAVTIEQQVAADAPMCPICLSLGTPIEAPGVAIPVDQLRIGDPIWTLDRQGERVAGTVVALGSTAAPPGHVVIQLTLADGRTVTASPGHPLADGRRLGDLAIGDVVDGSHATGVAILAYEAASTYDLVVSGETGIYLAGGIPLRSTIDPRP